MKTYRRLEASLFALCLAVSCACATLTQHPHSHSKQEPIQGDFELQSIAKPARYETGQLWNFSNNIFLQLAKHGFGFRRKTAETYKVITSYEMPDLPWYTNRNRKGRVSKFNDLKMQRSRNNDETGDAYQFAASEPNQVVRSAQLQRSIDQNGSPRGATQPQTNRRKEEDVGVAVL
jgi:hypothetical protein